MMEMIKLRFEVMSVDYYNGKNEDEAFTLTVTNFPLLYRICENIRECWDSRVMWLMN